MKTMTMSQCVSAAVLLVLLGSTWMHVQAGETDIRRILGIFISPEPLLSFAML